MIRRPPRSTLDRSSAASDVYKRQPLYVANSNFFPFITGKAFAFRIIVEIVLVLWLVSVSYTHLRAHETVLDFVFRLLLEKKKKHTLEYISPSQSCQLNQLHHIKYIYQTTTATINIILYVD